MYSQMNRPTKLQLSEQERRGEITAAEYYRALEERSGAIDFAAKKRKAGTDKDKGTKESPKCKAGNYQCRGKKGVACIPKSKGCRADLSNVNPARKAYIDATIKALQAEGAKPTIARVGRKLGAPSVQLTPEQYGKALELNISQRSLIRGDATREQLRAIGVDVDGLQQNPTKPDVGSSSAAFTRLDATTPPSKDSAQKVADMQAKALSKGYGAIDDIKDVPLDQLNPGVARYVESLRANSDRSPNDILLVKNGDFYMTYFDDAQKLAVSLDREASGTQLVKDLPPFGQKSPIPTAVQFAGFPDHALGRYGADIVGAGFNIVIADPPDPAQPPAPKPQTKLEKAKAEQDARAKLTDTPAGRFFTVDAASLTTDTKPDPAIVDLIERSNGILLRPPVLSESGLEEFSAVTNPEIAAAAKAAYERSGNTALEMFPAIVTKDPAAAQRQAALLANDTGVEIPSSYIDPRGGMSAEKRADFDTAAARFSTMDLALIRDPNAATRNFDPTEIDTLAREMLASGDTIAPIPLAMTKPIGEGLDGDGEYAPVAGFKALAAANRARELDPMFDKVASNFVDLDNPAEVEQLRRFYGDTGGKSVTRTSNPVASAISQVRLKSMPQGELDQINSLIAGAAGNFQTRAELLQIAKSDAGLKRLPTFLDGLSDEDLVQAIEKMERPIANEVRKREESQPGGTTSAATVNEVLELMRLMRPS